MVTLNESSFPAIFLLVFNWLINDGLVVVPDLLGLLGSRLRPPNNSGNNLILVFLVFN